MTYKTIPFDWEKFKAGGKLISNGVTEIERHIFVWLPDKIMVLLKDKTFRLVEEEEWSVDWQLQIPVVEEIRQANIYKDGDIGSFAKPEASKICRIEERFSGFVLRGIFIDGKLSAKPEVIEVEKEII